MTIHSLSDGYLLLPISMSRIPNTQDPAACLEIIEYFQKEHPLSQSDIIILYTNSLYLNTTTETAWSAKRRLVSQMLSHRKALERLLENHRTIPREAIHFMAWDEIVLAAPDYSRFYQALLRRAKVDQDFAAIMASSTKREQNDATHSFLLEETVVTHILRQKLVRLPRGIAQNDTFRLVVYPGPYIAIDLYQWKHKLLPQNREQPFYASQFNFKDKQLYNFDEMEITDDFNWQFE